MKFDELRRTTDPPRIDEGEPSELGRLVRRSRGRRLSGHVAARIAERLAPERAFAASSMSSATSTRRGASGRLGGLKAGATALALVGLGGALFAWETRRMEYSTPPASAVSTGAVVTALPPPSPKPAPPAVEAPAETSSIPVGALPSSKAPATVPNASGRSAAQRPASPLHASPTSESEFALIKRAEDTLASDPSRALAIVEEHARTFSAGELVQEREMVAVEALARLQRRAEARRRAEALLARFPRTPYVARLERALGEPLSPALSATTDR